MKRALAIVLVLAISSPTYGSDGGVVQADGRDTGITQPKGLNVKRALVTLQNGDVILVEEGCWLRTDVCVEAARHLRTDEQEAAELEKKTMEAFREMAPIIAGLLLLAASIGFAVGQITAPYTPKILPVR